MTTLVSGNLIETESSLVYDSGIITTAVTTLDVTGLDLDEGESYLCRTTFINDGAALSRYYLTVNGAHTLSGYQTQETQAWATSVATSKIIEPRVGYAPIGGSSVGEILLRLDRGFPYQIGNHITFVAPNIEHTTYAGFKSAAITAPITSLRITASQTSGIGVDSRLKIFRHLI